MKDERSKPEIIRGVADGDRLVLTYEEDTVRQLRLRYRTFFVRASEINRKDGWQHYRVALSAELRQIIIIAERKEAGDGSQDGTQ